MDNYRELKICCDPGFGHLPPLLVLINPFCCELRIKLAAKIWTIIDNSKFAVTQVSDTYGCLGFVLLFYSFLTFLTFLRSKRYRWT